MKVNYLKKTFQSTNKIIKNNKMIIIWLYILSNLSVFLNSLTGITSLIPLVSTNEIAMMAIIFTTTVNLLPLFIFDMLSIIVFLIILKNIDKNGVNEKINIKTGYKSAIGTFVGSLIILITILSIYFTSLITYIYILFERIPTLEQFKSFASGNTEIFLLTGFQEFMISLTSILFFAIIVYFSSYFVSKAIEKDNFKDSMKTVLNVFNILKWKHIYSNKSYFVFVAKYLGIIIVFSMIFIVISVFVTLFLNIILQYISEAGIKYFISYVVEGIFTSIFIYYITLYTYLFIYNIRFVIDDKNLNNSEKED